MRKQRIHIFVPSDLDLWSLELKYALPAVTRVQVHVCTTCGFFTAIANYTSKIDERRVALANPWFQKGDLLEGLGQKSASGVQG